MTNDSMTRLKKIQAETQAFLDEKGIEFQDQTRLAGWRRFAHFWLVIAKGFVRNRCPVRASALAYTTLLAFIPLMAVVVGISTTFLKHEGEKPIQLFIDKFVANVAPQLDLVSETNVTGVAGAELAPAQSTAVGRQEVVRRITEYINNVHSGALGLLGVVSLILVAILLLSNIETTFNDIWGVAQGRTWRMRIVQYWAAITLGPLILLLAIVLTSGPYFERTTRMLASLPVIGHSMFILLPFILLIAGFTLFYQLMPHTHVSFRAALAGGLIGGCLWQLNTIFNVVYISRVVTYSKIYGSLGMVPVFLIGLYFSWLIVLFGAQVSYAFQNRQAYLQEKQAEGVNQRGREFIALRAMTCLAERFHKGQKSPTIAELGCALGVSSRLVSQALQAMAHANLVHEVAGREIAFVPARPLGQISYQDILQAMRTGQGAELSTRDEPARTLVRQELERIRQAEHVAASATTLQVLVDKLDSR